MSDLYKNKYRVESARLQNWNYGWEAAYFITICTHEKEHFFGKIIDGKMVLSNVGVIADVLWHGIKNHAKHVELGEFVVMPNHIHGILILKQDSEIPTIETTTNVETTHALSLHNNTNIHDNGNVNDNMDENDTKTEGQKRFQNQGKNTVSSIIGSYKSAVTRHANRLKFDFKWQTRFHDHIIRNDQSFEKITNYINTNPQNWNEDRFFKA